MRNKFLKLLLFAALLTLATSCLDQNYIMFEDDEWSTGGADTDRSLINSEIEMDDWDR